MPDLFIHRQTTANQVRFTTLALSEMETRILNAGAHALEIEKRHYSGLRQAVLDWAGPMAPPRAGWPRLTWRRFRRSGGGGRLGRAGGGRQPRVFVIKAGGIRWWSARLARAGQPFVANDCALTEGETPAIWLLTGPNMAGKSTFLRQNALIALLAQAGSLCRPRARIGLVSQMFSRVGASDDLARGGRPSWSRWSRRRRS
jgi:DNA mismatch repair protein MutS